uniref:Putative 23kda heat shock protein schsp23 n=1 Tax=Tabanus bromius TaxID=304241 RepID=A0A0K8TPK9_TABBR
MSLIPLLFGNLGDCGHRYNRDFGLGLAPLFYDLPSSLDKLRQELDKSVDGVVSSVGKEGFQVSMDVQQFKPSEITVKTKDDCIIVEGKHEEREDEHGYISRHFVRRYALPKGYDASQVTSTLSSDGVLTVKVPQPQAIKGNERVIQIQQTGPAHLSIKDNTEQTATK